MMRSVRLHEGSDRVLVGWCPFWSRGAREDLGPLPVDLVDDATRRVVVRANGRLILARHSLMQTADDLPTT